MKIKHIRKVNFYETDAQGVVHHSNYPRYFEECRGIFLERVGIPYHVLRNDYGIDVVLLELGVKYLRPVKFGDLMEIEFWIDSIDSYFFSFRYKIFVSKKVAEGYTKHCCVKKEDRKVIKIPSILKEKLEFEDD